MSDSLYVLGGQVTIPVEPVGLLASEGWMAGVWVKYSTIPVSFSGAVATVDRSDGTGVLAGFLITGPQHKQPLELQSDMWTTDKRQRSGGETRADWTAFDAGAAFEFDDFKQLHRMGSRIVTMALPNEGFYRVYTFEKTWSGGGLTYQSGDKLYVSSAGYFTKHQENASHPWTGYVVANVGSDIEGDYIIVVEAIA